MSTRHLPNKSKALAQEEVYTRRKKVIRESFLKNIRKRGKVFRVKKKTIGCQLREDIDKDILRTKIDSALHVAVGPNPLFILKASKIIGAGRGVFVSDKHVMAPKGSILPYAGVLVEGLTPQVLESQYVVKLKKNMFLVGSKHYTDGQPLGNYINRVMSKKLWKSDEVKKIREKTSGMQNLSTKNAELKVFENIAYFLLKKNVPSGGEILTTYGRGFNIVKPIIKE